jgi:hypothetical protein
MRTSALQQFGIDLFHIIQNDTLSSAVTSVAFFAGGEGEVTEVKTLCLRSFFLGSLESLFQENLCVASSAWAAEETKDAYDLCQVGASSPENRPRN